MDIKIGETIKILANNKIWYEGKVKNCGSIFFKDETVAWFSETEGITLEVENKEFFIPFNSIILIVKEQGELKITKF